MAQVSNRFFVRAIQDGQVASGYLRASKPLQQFYDKTSVAPDWTVAANKPVITAYARLGGSLKAPFTNKWYYNGYEILFSGNNSTNFTYTKSGTEYPLFVKGTTTVGGVTMPTLTINGNLASAGNPDQDVISNIGTIETAGEQLDYAMDILVRIGQLAQNGKWGSFDYGGTGNSVITSAVSTDPGYQVVLLPQLYNGTTAAQASDFQVKWYIEGVDYSSNTDNRFDTMKSGTQAQMGLTLTEPDVVDNVTVRCDFYDKSATPVQLCSAYIEVDDAQDDDEMQITHPGGESNTNLRQGESVTFTVWMASRTNPTAVKTAYTNYKVKLLSSASKVITPSIASINGGASVDANGYMDITKNNVTVVGSTVAAKAGQVTIDFDTAHNNGDSISGVIVAS